MLSESSLPLLTVPDCADSRWTKEELRNQTRRGKAEVKSDKRKSAFKAWNRDQRGCCGISWMTRTVFVFIAFFFIAGLVVTLYFTIPRAVVFQFYDDQPFVNTTTPYFARTPANFTFDADLQLMCDSTASYLPVHFSDAKATVIDQDTGNVIAHGSLGNYKMKKGKNIPVRFPVTFSYAAVNASDQTWVNMYDACKYQFQGQTRGDLKFRLEVKQSIIGMVTKPVSQDSLLGIACPFMLPADGV